MGALPDANRSVPAAQRVHSPRCLKSEKRTSTAPMGSTANAIASSPGSIAIGGTTEPVMMISPPRSRSPKAASTSATCRTMSTHLPVLACGSLVRANSRPRRRTRQTRPSAALPVRAGAAPSPVVRPDAQSLMMIRHFVAGGFNRAGAPPSPHQDDLLLRGVAEAVPACARRIHDVPFDRRDLAMIGVDVAVAFEHDEELVAVAMPMPLVACARLKHGPSHHMIGTGGFFVDQELDLHVDPAVLALEARDLGNIAEIGAIHFCRCSWPARRARFSFGLSRRSLHGRSPHLVAWASALHSRQLNSEPRSGDDRGSGLTTFTGEVGV